MKLLLICMAFALMNTCFMYFWGTAKTVVINVGVLIVGAIVVCRMSDDDLTLCLLVGAFVVPLVVGATLFGIAAGSLLKTPKST